MKTTLQKSPGHVQGVLILIQDTCLLGCNGTRCRYSGSSRKVPGLCRWPEDQYQVSSKFNHNVSLRRIDLAEEVVFITPVHAVVLVVALPGGDYTPLVVALEPVGSLRITMPAFEKGGRIAMHFKVWLLAIRTFHEYCQLTTPYNRPS